MSKNLDFDVTKIVKVDINAVEPNPWNPKEKDTKEFQKIVSSVKRNGLKGAILVRELEKGKYQIIDGEQRYTAAKFLKFPEINVYNEGQMDDKLAKELTIWYQQQVPFDKVQEAKMVSELLMEYNDSEGLPYTEEEIVELKQLADFDFDSFADKGEEAKDNEHKTLSFTLTNDEFSDAMDFFNRADQSREEVLMDLVAAGQ